jgi:hypothetical protein
VDIGTLALTISADSSTFEKALGQAAQQANQFAAHVIGVFGNVAGKIEAVTNAFKANPWGVLLVGALGLKQSIDTLAASMSDLVSQGNAAAASQGALVKRFGLTALAAGGLLLQARTLGIDSDTVTTSMRAFSVRLGEAAVSGGVAEHGLQRLGLSAQALARVPVDEALAAIGDGLRNVTDAGERNTLMYQILGRRAAELGPLILRGSGDMDLARRRSLAWGLTFTETQLQAVKDAQIASAGASAAMSSVQQSIANALAVAAAPVRQFAAELQIAFIDFIQSGAVKSLRQIIVEAGKHALAAIAGIKSALADAAPILAVVRDLWNGIFAEIARAFGQTGDTADFWRDIAGVLISGVAVGLIVVGAALHPIVAMIEAAVFATKVFAAQAMNLANAFRDIARLARVIAPLMGLGFVTGNLPTAAPQAPQSTAGLSAPGTSGTLMTMLLDLQEQSQIMARQVGLANQIQAAYQGVGAALMDARRAGETIGMSPAQVRIAELEREVLAIEALRPPVNAVTAALSLMGGAMAGTARQAEELGTAIARSNLEALKAQEAYNQSAMDAKKIIADNITPLEKYQEELKQIDFLEAVGNLTREQAERAIGRISQQFAGQDHSHQAQLASGLTAGSSESISAINQANANVNLIDPIERVRQAIERANATAAETLYYGRRMSQAIVSGEAFRVVPLPPR